MKYAQVAIPSPLYSSFTYDACDLSVAVGARVEVPFGRRTAIGVVTCLLDELPRGLCSSKLKRISKVLDETPALSEKLVTLILWMSKYYVCPIGEAMRAALPSRLMKAKPPKTTRPARPHESRSKNEKKIALNPDQKSALAAIVSSIGDAERRPFLLHGITGSGKTEVYLALFEELARNGKQGLLLVPEIGLTPQLAARATAKFGDRVAIYHSDLTDAQRHEEWMRMKSGAVDVVVGTRSALFAPFPNLGAIVVDEEHDGSYKQDDGFMYSARDAAVVRANIEGVPVVLGSATPSLESFANAHLGKYQLLLLDKRIGGARLPDIEVIDMRVRQKGPREFHSLSPALFSAIKDALDAKEQVLLYIGRRGFAGTMQCASCGHVITCPNCDISLTAHGGIRTDKEYLTCHYCDYTIDVPAKCPECGQDDLLAVGHGTERLEAEISDFFPDARIARLDSDMAGSPVRRRKVLDDMRRGRIDILIGTQMVTKGHDYSAITLVGVVAADMPLTIPDFRSAERTFQVLTQVAGRAGRGESPGRVIIQTRKPEHFSFQSAAVHDFGGFVSRELAHRKELSYPPYSRFANIRISSPKREVAERTAKAAAKALSAIKGADPRFGAIGWLGPAPALIEKLRGRFRWQILVKAPSAALMTAFLASIQPKVLGKLPPKVRAAIDVDPVNMM